ncbi:MAG: exodeoxyribonuclease VII large subunit, partial [Candidatus Dormibacteria bacterium]
MRPAPADRRALSVGAVAELIRQAFESIGQFRQLAVRGEITGLYRHANGALYFDLKDEDAVLNCVAWSENAMRFPKLRDGLSVVATGRIEAYAKKSRYQLVVRDVALDGVGRLHALFEARKRKLAGEGLFEPARKRPLPPFPFRVALVSSRAAAGAIDFTTILAREAPHVAIVWCETAVQGANAPWEIVRALQRASRLDVDLIVVTRGGGSFEDMFCFSDESVVRAVAAARHPVVSAVGHAIDQQLCDLVADLYVETPTAAAKRIARPTEQLRADVDGLTARLRRSLSTILDRRGNALALALKGSRLALPDRLVSPRRQRALDAASALDQRFNAAIAERRERVRAAAATLVARSPMVRLGDRARQLAQLTFRSRHAVAELAGRRRERLLSSRGRLAPAFAERISRMSRRFEVARAQLMARD